MYTCQCEGLQMGLGNGVLLKEAAAFWRFPLIEVSPGHTKLLSNSPPTLYCSFSHLALHLSTKQQGDKASVPCCDID